MMRRSLMLFLVVVLSTAAITCTTYSRVQPGSVDMAALARVDTRFNAELAQVIRNPGLATFERDYCGDRMVRDVFTRRLRRLQRSSQDDSIRPEIVKDLQVLRTLVQLKVDEAFATGAVPRDLNVTMGRDFAVESIGAPRQSITLANQ